MSARPTELPTPGAPDTLYVVDLPGYVHRAYHALEPLHAPSGETTHASYGTLIMLTKLMNERKPAYLAAAFEGAGNFRDALDPRYKATRAPPPPDLHHQMRRARQLVEAHRIPILQVDGFEADDVIATMARQAKAAGLFVVIASADKDLMQLVDDRCVMWDAMRDRVYGHPEVVHKFGVPPAQVRDLLALVGDTSDNVPGVKGVGNKTAAELLAQFGTLEAIYERLAEVKKDRVRGLLIEHKDDALVSQKLVSLRADAPVTFDKAALRNDGVDVERLRVLYAELGFTAKLAALPQKGTPPVAAVKLEVETVLDREALAALAERITAAGRVAVHVHTTPDEAMRAGISGVSFAITPGKAAYVPLGHRYLGVPKQVTLSAFAGVMGPVLADAKIEKLGHDTKRGDVVLLRHGMRLAGVTFDSMLGSYMLDSEGANDLGSVAEREAGVRMTTFEAIAPKQRGKTAPTLDEVPIEEAAPFAGAYPDAILRVEQKQVPHLAEAQVLDLLRTLELPLSSLLAELETTGAMVDTKALGALGETMSRELGSLEERARAASGHRDLNVASPKQLETILFDELGLQSTKRTKTGRSTDAEALEAIADAHPLPGIVLEHRAIAKLKGTYVDALPRLIHPDTHRIHCHWRQAVAATGRISSEEPNLQNIPVRTALGREIRKAFVAPPGHVFLSADYSQIELRVLAHLSQDPVMVEAFRTGQDIHTRTAMEVFGVSAGDVTDDMRRKSKTINFGVIYGMGELALSKRLGIPRKQAAIFIDAYFEKYAGVARFMHATMVEAKRTERVRTMLGRLRLLPDLRTTDRMRRAAAERIAQNTPIQGTAADILKLAMVKLAEPVVKGARMVLTVHDELDFEVPEERAAEAAERIKQVMETVVSLDVPLVVDVGYGKSWADAH